MRSLTVLYDSTCDLCRAARVWLEREPMFIPLNFVAAGTPLAKRRFPQLDVASTLRDITVIDDEGSVYRGAKAWVLCLWATRRYRAWALTLGSPRAMPAAKRFVNWVSRHRGQLGAAGWVLRRMG